MLVTRLPRADAASLSVIGPLVLSQLCTPPLSSPHLALTPHLSQVYCAPNAPVRRHHVVDGAFSVRGRDLPHGDDTLYVAPHPHPTP